MGSYIHSEGDYLAEYSNPVGIAAFKTMEQNNDTDTLTAIVKKKIGFQKHDMTLGIQYRFKYFNFDKIKFDNVIDNAVQKYSKENIYSLFFEDSILLSEDNLLGISFMLQNYERNKDMNDESASQIRLSYIHTNEDFISKTFLSMQEFVPEPYMTAEAYIGNPNLKKEKYGLITEELKYENSTNELSFLVGYGKNKRLLFADSTGVIYNSDIDVNIYLAALEYKYNFRLKDTLTLKFDYTRYNMPLNGGKYADHYNYLIRVLDSVEKFDIFNELVINKGYKYVGVGYDYSAGVKYNATKDFHISLKGENIFDQGLTRKYFYSLTPLQQYEVPVIEQKFMLSMEYLF